MSTDPYHLLDWFRPLRFGVLAVLILGALPLEGLAQSSSDSYAVISFQGQLMGDTGEPVADGDHDLTFRLYTAKTGGSALWEETQTASTEEGVFSALLGSVNSLAEVPFDTTYYLGVSVDGASELTPRTRLAATPYAHRSRSVEPGAVDSSGLADGAITRAKVAGEAIGTAQLAAGAVTGVKIAEGSADHGDVLKWDRFDGKWVPAPDEDSNTQNTYTAGTGLTLSNSEFSVADGGIGATQLAGGAVTRSKLEDGASDGQVLKWDASTTSWVLGTDNTGVSSISSDATLSGDGTSGSPLGIADGGVNTTQMADDAVALAKLAQNGATDQQVLKWDGGTSSWIVAADETGLSSLSTDATLSGDGTSTNPLGVADGSISTTQLADGAVTSLKIGTDAVGSAEIASGAVGTNELADGGIGTADFGSGVVTSTVISDGTITAADLGTGVVGSAELADLGVGTADLAADAVTTGKILDGEVGSSDLASGAVITGSLSDNSVSRPKLEDGSADGQLLSWDTGTTAWTFVGSGASDGDQLTWDGTANEWQAKVESASDRRLKTDIADLDYGLAELMELRAVSFSWKEAFKGNWQERKGRQLGLIAQQVEEVLPEAVIRPATNEDHYRLQYEHLTSLLVKAVQEQQAQIDQKDQQLDRQETKIDQLSQQVQQLKRQVQAVRAAVEARTKDAPVQQASTR